jgi:hypothetical protein
MFRNSFEDPVVPALRVSPARVPQSLVSLDELTLFDIIIRHLSDLDKIWQKHPLHNSPNFTLFRTLKMVHPLCDEESTIGKSETVPL